MQVSRPRTRSRPRRAAPRPLAAGGWWWRRLGRVCPVRSPAARGQPSVCTAGLRPARPSPRGYLRPGVEVEARRGVGARPGVHDELHQQVPARPGPRRTARARARAGAGPGAWDSCSRRGLLPAIGRRASLEPERIGILGLAHTQQPPPLPPPPLHTSSRSKSAAQLTERTRREGSEGCGRPAPPEQPPVPLAHARPDPEAVVVEGVYTPDTTPPPPCSHLRLPPDYIANVTGGAKLGRCGTAYPTGACVPRHEWGWPCQKGAASVKLYLGLRKGNG